MHRATPTAIQHRPSDSRRARHLTRAAPGPGQRPLRRTGESEKLAQVTEGAAMKNTADQPPGAPVGEQPRWRLDQSEERFRLMVEGVHDYAIFMLDTDGIVVTWNSGAERMKGYSSEEILGQHFSRFYPAEDLEAGKPAKELRTAIERDRVEDEGWRVRKDGSLFWASVVITALRDPAGVLQGFAKVTRDFTERRRFEERLAYQSLLLESVSDAVIATGENSLLTAWNAGAERLYGWRADEVLGRRITDILQTRESEGEQEEVLRVLHEDGEWRGEVIQRHKDGHTLHVEAATIMMGDGPTHIVSVNRDFGERKRALVVEERSRIARELHDSVSQALFSMTLQARALELALELEGRDPSDPVSEGIANIRDLTRAAQAEMRALIFELRPAALVEEGLVSALQKHAAALEAKEGLTVTVSVPSQPVSFDPDISENLYRLAREAVSNIAKHAAASTVQIRLACPDAAEGAVELVITDDGVGFDTGVSRPGHLGLKTMSERAARLGGTFQVTSAPGGGTTVRVSLPRNGRATPR